MEQKRVQTLEALENFIQTNKALLERTHADIERLKALRAEVEDGSVSSLQELTAKLDEPCFKLSSQLDGLPPLPPTLDWSAFPNADVAPFVTMATAAREAHAARTVPPKTQTSAPSSLRQFVAAQRAAILDPILDAFRLPDDLAALSSSEEEVDPEEERRAREREKIRELKKRRIEADGAALAGLGLGTRRPVAAVFVRRDVEDESAEVDISMADDEGASARSATGTGAGTVPVVVDTPATSSGSVALATPVERAGPTRERRASRKAQENAKNKDEAAARAKAKAKAKVKAKTQAKPNVEPGENEGEPGPEEPPLGKNGKAKSETYKQAWSVSEQHLLERLLEEIPDGEKNRWLKISKAMNGRRTARQVASRVQKYYEKLKRFGIEVAPGGSKPGA